MKATGVVRRIDDLGRVVIPKEIRKFLESVGSKKYVLPHKNKKRYIKDKITDNSIDQIVSACKSMSKTKTGASFGIKSSPKVTFTTLSLVEFSMLISNSKVSLGEMIGLMVKVILSPAEVRYGSFVP